MPFNHAFADSMWDSASGEVEQERTAKAMAVAMSRTASTAQILHTATSAVDLGNRMSLIEGSLAKVASEVGIEPSELIEAHRRQATLSMEALARQAQVKTASYDDKVRAWEDAIDRRERHGEEGHFNRSVRDQDSPSTGFGAHNRLHQPRYEPFTNRGAIAMDEERIPERDLPDSTDEQRQQYIRGGSQYDLHPVKVHPSQSLEYVGSENWTNPNNGRDMIEHQYRIHDGKEASRKQASKRLTALDRIAMIRQALAEGENPLAWIPEQNQGEGIAEDPSHSGNEEYLEGNFVTAPEPGVGADNQQQREGSRPKA